MDDHFEPRLSYKITSTSHSFKPIKLSKVLSDFQVNFNPLYYVEAAGVNPRSGDTRLVSSQQEEKWERQHFGEFFLGK